MTPKQQRFVDEYLIDLNATQAAVRAGYSAKTAYSIGEELLRKPDIAAAVAKAEAARSERTKIDADWVLRKAVELHDKAMADGAYAPAKGALDLIGKHVDVQAFRDQMHHTGRIEYQNLSDEEVAARIAAHEQARGKRPTAH
jgi:phage terminase small subunit